MTLLPQHKRCVNIASTRIVTEEISFEPATAVIVLVTIIHIIVVEVEIVTTTTPTQAQAKRKLWGE